MNKQQIVSFISEQMAGGRISPEDLMNIANNIPIQNNVVQNEIKSNIVNIATENVAKKQSHTSLINIFYWIGGIIAVAGVVILIAQNWMEIGFTGRILATLGISLACYVLGLILNKPHHWAVSQIMFVISAVLSPLGVMVLLERAYADFTLNLNITVSLILFFIYLVALLISRRNILVLISIGFATWLYYSIILKVVGINDINFEFIKWMTMILGFSYMLISFGYGAVSKSINQDVEGRRRMMNVLYGLGTIAILGSGISIGDSFDLIFILFIFAAFYGSVYLKSRVMLILASLFLIGHIFKLTSQYFEDTVTWPIALIVGGFLVIGIGYMTYYMNRRYMN